MPEGPSRRHLRYVSFEALYGRVVELLIDLQVIFQDLAKLWSQARSPSASVAVVGRTPRRGDVQAPGKKPNCLWHALGDANDIDLRQRLKRFLSLSSALARVAQVDPARCKKQRLHASACHSDLLCHPYQRRQRVSVSVESLWSTAGRTVGVCKKMPQRAHELRLRLPNNRQNPVRGAKAQSVVAVDMACDKIVAADVLPILQYIVSKARRIFRRVYIPISSGKPLINACAAGLKHVKKNGFSH